MTSVMDKSSDPGNNALHRHDNNWHKELLLTENDSASLATWLANPLSSLEVRSSSLLDPFLASDDPLFRMPNFMQWPMGSLPSNQALVNGSMPSSVPLPYGAQMYGTPLPRATPLPQHMVLGQQPVPSQSVQTLQHPVQLFQHQHHHHQPLNMRNHDQSPSKRKPASRRKLTVAEATAASKRARPLSPVGAGDGSESDLDTDLSGLQPLAKRRQTSGVGSDASSPADNPLRAPHMSDKKMRNKLAAEKYRKKKRREVEEQAHQLEAHRAQMNALQQHIQLQNHEITFLRQLLQVHNVPINYVQPQVIKMGGPARTFKSDVSPPPEPQQS